jgi:outer membrane protein OmpA-like peptidoglycan-associated protein
MSSLQKFNGSGALVYAENIDRFTQKGVKIDPRKEISMKNGTFGMDLGFVYERRSGKFNPRYGNYKSIYRTILYDYRLSVSLTDFAFKPIKFEAGKQSANYTLTADNVKKDTFNVADGQNADAYMQELQINNLVSKQSASGAFEMPLPTSLHANFDLHVSKYWFINTDALISFRGPNSKKMGSHYISTLTVTARAETQWISLYSPVSINARKELNWGAGFRFGPLFIGSGSVLSNMMKSDLRNIDAHAGLSIPIYQGARERKKKKDAEEKIEEPKPVAAAKPSKSNKIQDRDKDGVADDKDACPDVPGLPADNGCPDTDKDGLTDNVDKCPTIAGTAKYNGCPVPDTDNDGVTDEKDKCITIAGPVTNNGCPEIKQEIKKTVARAAKNLFFNSGKATLQTRSYPALNKLASILRADSTLTLEIEGHTDNIGNDVRNMKLSQLRADAAKQYLLEIGIDARKITTHGFGETEPIASNDTKEGRSKNRRIVINIKNY